MGRRTAWWKNRRSSKPSHGGDPMAPLDTERNCAEDEVIKEEHNMSMDPSSPTCEQPELDVVKDGELQVAAEINGVREECEEPKMSSMKVEVEKHTEDECTDHPPGVSEDVQSQSSCSNDDATEEDEEGTEDINDDALGSEIQAEVGNDDSTYGDEIHDVERTATGDSNEDTVDYSSAARSIDSSQNDTSEYATVAMTVNTSKTDNTDYTDDGILRDDEGNPVDLAEAEENMLRDDEGNIIDPKTLVMREPFLVLCDEYCEDLEGDDSRHESEIDHDTYVRFTIEAMVSEMVSFIEEENGEINTVSERCNSEESEEAPKEGCQEECAQEIDEANGEEVKEQESTSDGNAEPLQQGASPNRRPPTGRSRRRVRYGGRASAPQVNDDTVHIMFNNTLSTLVEESSVIIDEDSSEEDEKSHISYKSTRSEKFFKARWNYSLQVMRSEASTSKLIDARDEIDDMIRPKAYVPDDRSVCSDEGTI